MKKILKNSSLIALGIVIGVSFTSFATNDVISAIRDNITSIYIKNEKLNIPQDQTPISYNSRIYVPLRLISENMGLKVDYNANTKSISITEKTLSQEEKSAKYKEIYDEVKKDIEKEKIKEEENKDKTDYRGLPVLFKKDKFMMTLTQVVRTSKNHNSQFYFKIKNDNENPMVVEAFSAKFKYIDKKNNEVELDTQYISVNDMSIKSLSSLETGFDDTIFLTVKEIPEDINKGILSFEIHEVGSSEKTKVVIPIKFD